MRRDGHIVRVVRTITGRRRLVPELGSKNGQLRAAASGLRLSLDSLLHEAGSPSPSWARKPTPRRTTCAWTKAGPLRARTYAVAAILGMERLTEAGRQVVAFVIDARGQIQGCQTKNQLDPTEDRFYVPGHARQLFEVNGTKFGVAICHEGWRYPETVRWAAVRGAKIVFHPQLTGSDREGVRPTQWGAAGGAYYEKAMMMRSRENTIYFASVNYALRFQESATSLIAPSGQCQAYLPYGQEGVLVQAIKVEEATGLLATRYAPERLQECTKGAKEEPR